MNVFKKIYCRIYQTGFKIALPLMPYREPVILDNVKKIADVLKEKKISAVLLVIDKNLRQLKLSDELENSLSDSKIKFYIYDETVQNPTTTNVHEARKVYEDNGCQAIIGFGGGSPIDCAKCVGACIARPKKSIEKMNGVLKILKKTPLFFAVPTTAGTGSEVTLTTVITDENTRRKYTINDFPIIPDYAVHDYKLTMDLPPIITSTTGIDTLTHAVEAYIGKSTTKYTRKMAEEAIILVHKYLAKAYFEPHNIEARKAMQTAAYKAGIAFSMSYVGYVHAISHAVSGIYHTPHGLANSCILPYFLDEYGSKIDKKLARLSDILNLYDKTESVERRANAFRQFVWNMNKELNIPYKIKGIKEEDIPKIVEFADKEANPLYPVPILMGRDKLSEMVKKITR